MTLGDLDILVAMHHAQDRQIRVVLQRGDQIAGMAGPADLVEDHPGKIQRAVEGLIAQQKGHDAAAHAVAVDHQNNRSAQQLGELGVAV